MSVRTNTVDGITVHAGGLDDLAAVADQYAAGARTLPRGLNAEHLLAVADSLRAGVRVHDLGPIRFYADRFDGTPFRAPYAPRTTQEQQ